MSLIIAIDPGQSGGIAYGNRDWVKAEKMPGTPRDICDFLENLQAERGGGLFCYIENVGQYRTGNSGPAAVKFAEHCGCLKGLLIALRIPHDKAPPSKWQHYFIGKPDYPKIPKEIQGKERKKILAKRKQERKNKIKAKAQGLYPDLKITLATSDALGIFTWGIEQNR